MNSFCILHVHLCTLSMSLVMYLVAGSDVITVLLCSVSVLYLRRLILRIAVM